MSDNFLAQLQAAAQDKLKAMDTNRDRPIKPKSGKNRIRILPSWRGESDPTFSHSFGQHFVKGADGKTAAVYVCMDKTYDKPCPVCQAIGEGIMRSADDVTKKILDDSKSSGSILVNALVLDGDQPNTPVVYALTPTVFKSVLSIIMEYAAEGINILDPENGVDLIINREGSGRFDTKYTVQAAPKSKPVNRSVLSQLHDLDAYVDQANSQQEAKALTAVTGIAGGLPAPSTAGALPGASAPAQAPAQAAPTVDLNDVQMADDGLGEVLEGSATQAVTPETAPAAEPAPASAGGMSDDELDDLLADLG